MKTDKNPNAKLSFLERFGYGLGDYAGNLVYSAISAFLLVYYTNVVGANAAAAASMIAVSKLLDGISDLIMGYIIDHTHSKWGKARPWIARLCIPLAVCTVLMFSVPSQFAGKAQIAYMFLTYNLVSTIFYTGINVPYATMHGLMTTNQYERGLLGNFRMLLATAGTMTINTVVLKMTGFFGGGDAYAQKGWTLTFVVLMLVFVVLNMFTFFVCRERVTEQSEEREKVSFVKRNYRAFEKQILGAYGCGSVSMYFMMSCFFGSALYFTKYNMGNEGQYAMVQSAFRGSDCNHVLYAALYEKGKQEKCISSWNGNFYHWFSYGRCEYGLCHYLCILGCKRNWFWLWRCNDVWLSAGCHYLRGVV